MPELLTNATCPQAYATSGSSNAAASRRRASRSQSAFASPNASRSAAALDLVDPGVLRADLAAAGQVEHDVGPGRPGARDRAVGGAVAGHDDLEQVARVVEVERVTRPSPR